MLNFTYHAPTKVFFGKDSHKQIGEIIKGYGFRKIMMQYGKGSIKQNGLYDDVMASLNEHGIEVVECGGVSPNPNLEFVHEAVAIAKREQVEMILAVGGGSVLDSCKYTAAGAKYDGDVWDFPTRKAVLADALPVGCILTIAAAGSEMSASAVVTNEAECQKRGFGSDLNRCLFAVCNPELTYTVSPYQTGCGIVDSMAHTMERYFIDCEPTPLTDRLAESVLHSLVDAGRVLMEDPRDYEARATAMWGSSLAHNGLTGCGRGDFLAVHQLEHAISGEYPAVAHGAGLAVLFPAWAKFCYHRNVPRFAQFARRVWDITEPDDEKAALCGIEAMADFFKSLGMPSTLREFGIAEEKIPRLCDLCTNNGTRVIPSYIPMDYDAVKQIFESCY
ncbi:MAG: iron-containing alcohol dehydrogenase [Clostridia bacterium]|nr:iron-containing alcohol dehydrogenase [Clostridia bacterium]